MKSYSPRQVGRVLAKYDTSEVEVAVGDGLRLRMVETTDAYALLDRLIEREEASGAGRAMRFPYWAEVWPSALGLARWFAGADGSASGARPGRARELGCGVGLVGIALARLGWQVEATDYVEDALVFASHNARRNGVEGRHRVSYLDWCHPVGSRCDWLVGSDLAYDKALHPHLLRTVGTLLAPGGQLVLGDPGRPAAQPLFAALEEVGYDHRREAVEVRWKALAHTVEVHSFRRPAA